MSEFKTWHNDILGAKVTEALAENNFSALYVPNRQQAVTKVMELIPLAASVGIGGSWTIQELGLNDLLTARGNTVFNHNQPGLSPEESLAVRRRELTADVFLASTNAVTLDGQLVNVDGAGNRVAAMIFGPKQVIIVAGVNKIVRDVAAAEERIALYAAPINNKRLSRPNPCVQAGTCLKCKNSTRICNVTTIMHKRPSAVDLQIIIVGEDLGF